MKKGWTQKKIRENAWGLIFERWYLIAPTGNKYHFYRGCYFDAIFVPTTYDALSVRDKSEWIRKYDPNLTKLRRIMRSGKTRPHYYTDLNDKVHSYEQNIHDEYQQALQFIYDVEAKGGFAEQKEMNKWLDGNSEMTYLYAQSSPKVSYYSMP